MGLFSRKPELQDQALSELGQMFASPELVVDDPTPGSELPLVESDARIAWPLLQAMAKRLREAESAPTA